MLENALRVTSLKNYVSCCRWYASRDLQLCQKSGCYIWLASFFRQTNNICRAWIHRLQHAHSSVLAETMNTRLSPCDLTVVILWLLACLRQVFTSCSGVTTSHQLSLNYTVCQSAPGLCSRSWHLYKNFVKCINHRTWLNSSYLTTRPLWSSSKTPLTEP